MMKILLLTAAAFVGAAALAAAAAGPDGGPLQVAELARGDGARLKLCAGPAQVLFGGDRAVTVRFGGDGCGRGREGVLGLAVERDAGGARDPAAAVRAMIS